MGLAVVLVPPAIVMTTGWPTVTGAVGAVTVIDVVVLTLTTILAVCGVVAGVALAPLPLAGEPSPAVASTVVVRLVVN